MSSFDVIPAPVRMALEAVIDQYDSTNDKEQLIEDICTITVVTPMGDD